MSRRHDLSRLLRWYPPNWRSRYGDEFLVLLEDRLNGSSPTLWFRSSVALAGLRERCYGSGIVGRQCSPATQRRTGSLMVLVAWSIMVVGGAGLSKTAEHFDAALPSKSQFLAQFSFHVTVAAGVAGTLFVVLGAVAASSSFTRFLRISSGHDIRISLARPIVASSLVVVATAGLAWWAHHLTSSQRNGADVLYSSAFLAYALLVVVTIGLWTTFAVVAASKVDFTPRVLRWESWCAMGVSLMAVLVFVSTALWWNQMGLHAPWFLGGSAPGSNASPWSAQLIVIMLVMLLSTAIALWGASRVAMTYRPARRNAL